MNYTYHESSVAGTLLLAADDSALRVLHFVKESDDAVKPGWERGENAILREAIRQLDEFFAGTRHDFDLPLAPEGTDFQQRVWKALLTIPYGETISYKELAERVGSSNGFRAVGAANGRNPIAVIIPCHRVINADGGLGGFGGGLALKQALLDFETAHAPVVC